MAGRKYGLDTGSMNLRISQAGRELIIDEKNITISRKKDVIQAGDAAYDIFERTPPALKAQWPVKGGVIVDTDLLARNVDILMKKNAQSSGFFRSSHFYLATPSDITEVEKRAYHDMIMRSSYSSRHMFLVDKPMTAALGEGHDIFSPDPLMLVDMGAGSTEISIMMMGGIVVSSLIREGGFTVNSDIINSVRREFSLVIGEKSAESLKLKVEDTGVKREGSIRVSGRSLVSGLPAAADIPLSTVYNALESYYSRVMNGIQEALGRVPPQHAAVILGRGIIFTGGGSLGTKFREAMSEKKDIKSLFSDTPSLSTSKGLERILEDPAAYRNIIYSMREGSFY